MEEEKKKKKNKKKKNKQATKPTESVTLDASKSTSDGQSHVIEVEQNSNYEVSGVKGSSKEAQRCRDVDSGLNHANGSKEANLPKSEKQYWLGREASFLEKVKELEAEKDALIQKEGSLEERINQLLQEKAEIAQKEASEREKVKHLCNEKNASIQNEALLEERIKQLQKEMDENAQKQASERENIKQLHDEKNASMRNEAGLKERLAQLESEKDVWSCDKSILEQNILQLQREVEVYRQKEASLEVKILQLEGEKNSWVQKEVSLQEKKKQMEKERDSWILKEFSAGESVASLTDEVIKLRAQVIELESSKEGLLDDKLQLTKTVSGLQLQISNLENAAANKVTSEDGDANRQLEAACALVKKLVMENSELVEKINELYAELDRRGIGRGQISSEATRGAVTDQSSVISASAPELTMSVNGGHNANQPTDIISKASKTMPASEFFEDVTVEDQKNSEPMKIYDGRGLEKTSEIVEVDEIVHIPLDETETKEKNVGLPQDDDVGLVDSPLIGAPFRLISFVARYVSGADLVDSN
ncbi:Mitochondrial ATP synthase D chain-related protein [Striga hermonthica]|uniref:Mitochondrial ATP synthase D chain-related protein n=1 Tax=Striga hermonthica TaxID=68872 RepID=A0A9N7NU63_STRHE|nr:Mitochondrial ATP synthase D chain-related protein [Striga hermonthica]